ncbi:Polyhydroxyalkanoate synthesis regulator phasin [Geoalkalibacter ferrihydriticus]|uniref:Phasin superfamily protein n=2 Tax=Geoalkalibacter ferrihydriticus TaxID=392333 RepID=A0A0C2EEJ1_9BACT|nr:phasin family protein [Geoalkalibacter ferrihydriticus]KIH77043.1 phasin superfamily protein [Geoalkalibacter ferrihydriticus DSM 17813]SDL37530.1 Polyhydroxyalkanoate synthesis regulator phasin [Geoalkalibacter ferrihydriticus]
MFELLEKIMLTGMGAASMTQKKAEELLGEMKERFNVSEEEGKAFLEKMRKNAEDTQKKLEEMAQEEIRLAAQRVGVVTLEEFEKLQKKVQQMDKHLKELDKQVKELQK